MMNEENMNAMELSLDELESVTGGNTVNTGAGNAGVWKKFGDIATQQARYSLPNGTNVAILGAPKYNEAKGRNYVQIQFSHKGKTRKGWIAASIVGMGH